MAVQGCYDGLVDAPCASDIREITSVFVVFRRPTGQICSRTEAPSVTEQNRSTQFRICLKILPDLAQFLVHGCIHGIQFVRSVQGDIGDMALFLVLDGGEIHKFSPNSFF